MADPLIRDIESYLAGDWDSWDVEAAGLLKQCLERLTQREEDSAPVTPTLGEAMLYVGAAVRVQSPLAGSYRKTGIVIEHDAGEIHPWHVDFGEYSVWYSGWELELL